IIDFVFALFQFWNHQGYTDRSKYDTLCFYRRIYIALGNTNHLWNFRRNRVYHSFWSEYHQQYYTDRCDERKHEEDAIKRSYFTRSPQPNPTDCDDCTDGFHGIIPCSSFHRHVL